LVAAASPGETTQVVDGPFGFQEVIFLLGGVEVSRLESNTPNGHGSSASVPSSSNTAYGAVADTGVAAFLTTPGFGAPIGRAEGAGGLFGFGITSITEGLVLAARCEEEILRGQNLVANGQNTDQANAALSDCIEFTRNPIFGTGSDVSNANGYAGQTNPSDGEAAINEAINNAPYIIDANVLPFASGFEGGFSITDPNAKRPWLVFFNSSIAGLDDNRVGADREVLMQTFSVGSKVLWTPDMTIDLSGGYRTGTVQSAATASTLPGNISPPRLRQITF